MSRLLCLKHVALAVSVSPVPRDHRPQYSRKRSARLFFFFFFLNQGANQQLSLSHPFSVRLTSLWKFSQKAAKDYKPVLIPVSGRPWFGKNKDPLRTSDALPVSLDSIYMYIIYIYIYINRQFPPLPLPHVILFYFFVYVWTILLCVPHFCVKPRKIRNKKEDKSITERTKNSMLVKFWSCHLSCLFFLVANYWKITGLK